MSDGTDTPVDPGSLSEGDAAPRISVGPLEREDFVKYAGASGDFNPIHYDEPYATDAGNPSVFAQGMLVCGIASSMFTDWLGVEHVTTFRTRFQSRVFPGDEIEVTGTVTSVDESGSTITVEVEYVARNQDDEDIVGGDVVAELPAD